MNDESLRLEQTMHPDGFVDFYTLLGITSSTPNTEIQESINALYQEAQMNRDHRNPARRRDYQTLLEILPQARLVLMDEARSKRYRAYCHAVEMELPRMPYPEFLSALVREKEVVDARSDILTIRDLSRLRPATPEEVEAKQAPSPAKAEAPAAVPVAAAPPEVKAAPAIPTPPPPAPMVAEEPAAEKVSVAPMAEPAAPQAMPSASPVAEGQRFSLPAIVGGIVILLGLLVALPALTGIPLILAVVLSIFSAGICAYVFSLTGEVVEA